MARPGFLWGSWESMIEIFVDVIEGFHVQRFRMPIFVSFFWRRVFQTLTKGKQRFRYYFATVPIWKKSRLVWCAQLPPWRVQLCVIQNMINLKWIRFIRSCIVSWAYPVLCGGPSGEICGGAICTVLLSSGMAPWRRRCMISKHIGWIFINLQFAERDSC